jgi:hypothetical protein
MRGLIAQGLFFLSALATIVVMLMIIAKERRRKRKAVNAKKAGEYAQTMSYQRPGKLHLD